MAERTIVIIKPDGVKRGESVVRQIKQRYLEAGMRIIQEIDLQLDRHQIREFYKEHEGRSFFEDLVSAMTIGPCLVLVIEGEEAVEKVRAINGATDPAKAAPRTIRYDFRDAESGGPRNIVHGSDSSIVASREFLILVE